MPREGRPAWPHGEMPPIDRDMYPGGEESEPKMTWEKREARLLRGGRVEPEAPEDPKKPQRVWEALETASDFDIPRQGSSETLEEATKARGDKELARLAKSFEKAKARKKAEEVAEHNERMRNETKKKLTRAEMAREEAKKRRKGGVQRAVERRRKERAEERERQREIEQIRQKAATMETGTPPPSGAGVREHPRDTAPDPRPREETSRPPEVPLQYRVQKIEEVRKPPATLPPSPIEKVEERREEDFRGVTEELKLLWSDLKRGTRNILPFLFVAAQDHPSPAHSERTERAEQHIENQRERREYPPNQEGKMVRILLEDGVEAFNKERERYRKANGELTREDAKIFSDWRREFWRVLNSRQFDNATTGVSGRPMEIGWGEEHRILDPETLDFSGADFSDLTLNWVDLSGAKLEGVNFRGALLDDYVILEGAHLKKADFTGAHISEQVDFANTDLTGALLVDLDNSPTYKGPRMTRATVTGATIEHVNFVPNPRQIQTIYGLEKAKGSGADLWREIKRDPTQKEYELWMDANGFAPDADHWKSTDPDGNFPLWRELEKK